MPPRCTINAVCLSALLCLPLQDTVIGMSYIKTRASRLDYSCWYEGPSPFGLYRNPSAPLPANVTLTGTYQAFNTPAMHIATLPNTIYETALLQYFPLATRVPFSSMDAAYASVGVTTNAGKCGVWMV